VKTAGYVRNKSEVLAQRPERKELAKGPANSRQLDTISETRQCCVLLEHAWHFTP